ncbi:PP2C family protein-serine/threonine phosphatase [Yinghuangia soli]|uniref:SpoIIE family protein phosphatase n=1 Tax=Yinghuangia soli TaxID=2908204 RepID=A0AA41Q8E3_9ACTN|nr:GAF domain-containing SpoIIE family protein phosphatase [Yinghuangia soli]MCF2532092.1 SpoIIE family protein phosphatase [Yinghuangia soli]
MNDGDSMLHPPWPAPAGAVPFGADDHARSGFDLAHLLGRLPPGLRTVYRASESLVRSTSRDEVLDLLLRTFPRLLRATQSTVALGDGVRLHMHRVPDPAPHVDAPRLVPLDAAHPVAAVARTGREWFLTVEEHDELPGETKPLVAAPGTRAWWMLPLVDDGGRPVGAWTLGFRAPRPPAAETRAAVREVTRMAGHALDRTGATQPYLDFVEAFRAGTSFEHPGAVPGIESAVRHRPAHEAADLGGDWYDVFALHGDLVVLAVGDVQGHGPEAAPMMSRLRTLLRAYAVDYRDPGMVLTRVNDFLDRFPTPVHATCLLAYLDTGTGEVVAASAGHPPLMVAAAHGVEVLEHPGDTLPLGVAGGQRYVSTRFALAPGGILALSTDGLLEGPDIDLDAGIARLARDLSGDVSVPLDDLAGAMFTHADHTGHRDDATLLLARRDRITS